MPPFVFCFVVIYMSFKEDLKYKVKGYLNVILNKTLNGLVFGIDKFNEAYELGEKYLFFDKTKTFWKKGKLYHYFKGPIKVNNSFWIENPFLYEDFSFEEYHEAVKNNEVMRFLYSKKLHEQRKLPSNKVFLVLDNRNFTFDLSLCRIMIDNKICVFVSTKEQSKYPWDYYEEIK